MCSQPSNSASLGDAASRPLRPLLPAASPRSDAPPTQSKRARVSLACAACRTRKTKCNGERPTCNECVARESHCQYTETETTQTKRKHHDLEELFELLKSLSDEEASELLGRIRAGVEPRDIVETVTHGNMLMQFASSSGSASGGSQHGSGGNGSGDSQEPSRRSGSPTKHNN
ncbi:hypothetical protein BDW02DRAFT_565835 [Decorospora gaudefroyi]|uniref:Zn(2)-C6 fungal-type domain-containing protein n=1 Tax=Decorospora gaudefroyi TaxID=184978 RepID=A0A6A5KPE2_9PLEO|nr:hypothetical protein BDW02DRAFT_565835 [Decorospora gaudefroyi]